MIPVAYIGVGSNIEPTEHIPRALEALQRELEVRASSTFYWSEAVARADQPPFLNGVWQVGTSLGPRELKFELLRPLEQRLGRRRSADKHAPRTIDLDLLLHGETCLQEPDLELPDPDIPRRAFLWKPLLELEPGLRDRLGPLAESSAGELRPDPEFTRLLRDALNPTPSP